MVANKVPMIDLQFGEKEALYVAALEHRLQAMALNEVKYCALIEMLTGETWETQETSFKAGELKKIAVTATQRRLARSVAEAERIVDANLQKANEV